MVLRQLIHRLGRIDWRAYATTLFSAIGARFKRAPKRWSATIVVALLACYAFYLGLRVVTEFEQRHWDVPAHVFAAPQELYAGLSLTAAELSADLAQTGYQQVDELRRPGEYRLEPSGVRVWTRRFAFWDAEEPSRQLAIDFEQGRIVSIHDAAGQAVPIVRLEPMRLGSLFTQHHEDRILVEPGAMPPLLIDTLIAVEDRKFERHHGLDFAAIARAAWVNFKHREIRQGGSTLTQQLVKSYFLDSRQTLGRKLREAVMAVALELRYDKFELLHAYVNEIYLGQHGARAIHGFGLASEFYFAKRLDELSVHETALLVAIVKGPSYYDPRRQPERALARRNRVLQTLAEREVIDAETAAEASRQGLDVTARTGVTSRYQPAYMDLVRAQLAADYSPEDLATQGLRVFTSLDPSAQATAERELAEGLVRLDTRRKEAADLAQGLTSLDAEREDATDFDHGLAELNAGPDDIAGLAAGLPQLDAEQDEAADEQDADDHETLEGAVVITRPQTGEVIALAGGRNAGFDGFNRALDARRPVGSLIKPLVYLAALESGDYSLASTLDDEPIDVPLSNGDVWSPDNFSDESHGPVPMVRALADSYNQATVRLGLEVGVDKVAALFERLGLTAEPPAYPSLLLGAVELSPFEIAQLYNSLANGGDRMPLKAVRSVTDADGELLNRYPLELLPAADADAIHQLNQALVQVVERGTGKTARGLLPPDLTVAGKTGTSDDFKDSWFAGFSNEHLAVVWVGRDDNTTVELTGSSGALTIWAPIFASLTPAISYDPPSSTTLADIWLDYDSGLMTRRGCGNSVQLPVPPDAELPRRGACGLGLSELGQRVREWFGGGGSR